MSKAEARRRPVALGHVYLCVLTHITFVTEKRRKVQVWNRDAQKKKSTAVLVLFCYARCTHSKAKKKKKMFVVAVFSLKTVVKLISPFH